MSLILKVLSFKNQPNTEIKAVSIGNDGGSIGRSDDNTLVLPDTEKFVSRHHATISFENGCYYLSDSSLGGVYINGQEPPLHNATVRIDNGMQLKIGEYDIAVSIADEPVMDDFPFMSEPITPEPKAFLYAEEHWEELEEMGPNSLMTDNFPRHEELVETKASEEPVAFESAFKGNQSPLSDSYIAPDIIAPVSIEEIPENISFDDFFSDSDVEAKSFSPQDQAVNKPKVDDDFEDIFGAAISDMAAEIDQVTVTAPVGLAGDSQADKTGNDLHAGEQALHSLPDESATTKLISETSTENNHEASAVGWTDESSPTSKVIEPPFPAHEEKPAVTRTVTVNRSANIEIKPEPVAGRVGDSQSRTASLTDNALFNAFLQGAAVECSEIHAEQQTETLHRIGRMFRKLIEGTGAVLRSRAEFKSLFRITMTVMKVNENNPFKFMLPDDLLRHLIDNKTSGYMDSTVAIEEAFNDLMYHQLAMQAGIQASLTDLLKEFDPKIIEKQFEQGIVLQKKAKCWDRYEETYHSTVEDVVENFYGDAFVKAYEQQMRELTNNRKK